MSRSRVCRRNFVSDMSEGDVVLIKVKFAEKHFEVSASPDTTVAEVRLVFRPLPLPPARVRRAVLDSRP